MPAVGVGISPVVGSGGVGFSGASGWWAAGGASGCVVAYQPKGAASLAASYSNLANPGTYDAAPGVAPAWAALTGWTFNGSAHYLDTGWVPSANCTIGIRFQNLAVNGWLVGVHDWIAGGNIGMEVGNWGGRFYNEANRFDGLYFAATKVLAWDDAYTDGSLVGTISGAGPAVAFSWFIGARSARGNPDLFCGADVLAFVGYDNKLDASEVAAVSAAMAAL